MVNIVTDSTADLGELAARRNITVVPLLVHMGGRTYKDGQGFGAQDLFRLVDELGELPKTAAPLVGDYLAAFDRPDDTVYIGIAEALSGSVRNAALAAQSLPPGRVRVIDSHNLSTGIGQLVLLAADLRDQGCSAAEIEAALLAARNRLHTILVLDTLRYVHMGGRCTAVQSIMGSVLHIRPVLAVRLDGSLEIRERVRGPRKRALQSLLNDLTAHLPELDRRRIFITHSGAHEDAVALAAEVQSIAAPDEVLVTEAGCVISSHCGPGTVGILYLTK